MNAPLSGPRRAGNPTKARLTLDEYYRMAEAGILDRFERTELIEGEVFAMSPVHLPHARLHAALYDALRASADATDAGLEVLIGPTTELSQFDAPMPDIVVMDSAIAADAQRGIPHDAIKLVVEVADSTSSYDLGRKRKLYASHGVPEYWVTLVRKRKVERFAEPLDGEYRRHDSFGFDEEVQSLTIGSLKVAAGTLRR